MTKRSPTAGPTGREEAELHALVLQAWELRGTGYTVDAAAAIVDWHLRRPLARHERRLERQARLVRLLRDTNPAGDPAGTWRAA